MSPINPVDETKISWARLSCILTYLSQSLVAFLVPAVEIFPFIKHKWLPRFCVPELAICGRGINGEEHVWKKSIGKIKST